MRDPYQAYAENGVVGGDPLRLVIVMYETAIRRTQEARECLESGDIWGRTRAISKASAILTELIASLNPEVGTNIGLNLDRLYHYMQRRLQEAHVRKSVEPLIEVEKLLRNLLEAWYSVAESAIRTDAQLANPAAPRQRLDEVVSSYAAYLPETTEPEKRAAVVG